MGDLDLPERRYTSNRVEEEDAQKCPCGEAIEGGTYMVAECDLYKEEWDLLRVEEEGREVN